MQAPDTPHLAGSAGRLFTLPNLARNLARSTALGLTLGLLLSACGGGSGGSTLGSGGETVKPPVTAPGTGVETPADLGSDGKPREVRCAR
jgi:hypothetical protein